MTTHTLLCTTCSTPVTVRAPDYFPIDPALYVCEACRRESGQLELVRERVEGRVEELRYDPAMAVMPL